MDPSRRFAREGYTLPSDCMGSTDTATGGPSTPALEAALADVEAAVGATPDDASSIYSVCSGPDTTGAPGADDEDADSAASRLPLAFRRLCHVARRIAVLRQRCAVARRQLRDADAAAATLGSALLLACVDGGPAGDVDASVVGSLVGLAPSPPDTFRLAPPPCTLRLAPSPSNDTFRLAAGRARQLRQSLSQLESQLDVEQRLLLWPGLEQWRLAVAEHHRQQDQHAGDHDHPSAADARLDRLLRATQQTLPRLGRRRLEHLRRFIDTMLLGAAAVSPGPGAAPPETFF